MKIVGITGGIGSGKTTVTKMFYKLGVPIYYADVEAKQLTNTSKKIKKELINLLGEQTYVNGKLNKEYVASIIFSDTKMLEKVNKIIHPRVAKHFKKWQKKQNFAYVMYEAAILFENDGYKKCDFIILVTAPEKDRIARVIKRDNTTKQKVLDRIKNQWSDSRKSKLSDYIINNIDLTKTELQVIKIHKELLAKG